MADMTRAEIDALVAELKWPFYDMFGQLTPHVVIEQREKAAIAITQLLAALETPKASEPEPVAPRLPGSEIVRRFNPKTGLFDHVSRGP